jgi:hypothetical protein
MLPKNFLVEKRIPGDSIDARVVMYGNLAIISTTNDMIARAKRVSMSENSIVDTYPVGMSVEQQIGVMAEIKFAPRTRVKPTCYLTPLFLEAMFPQLARPNSN